MIFSLKQVVTLGLMTLAFSSAVFAGQGGNGGGAHYCTDLSGNLTSIEAFDLYEGRERYGIAVEYYSGSLTKDEIIQEKLNRISEKRPGLARMIKRTLDYMKEDGVIIDKKKKVLTKVEDANEWFVDEGCEYRQLANWLDDETPSTRHGIILRDWTNYSKLDPMNQAAIDLHEALYKLLRLITKESGDSTIIRKFVAQLFSDSELIHVIPESKTEVGFFKENFQTSKFRTYTANVMNYSKKCGEQPQLSIEVLQLNNSRFPVKVNYTNVERVYQTETPVNFVLTEEANVNETSLTSFIVKTRYSIKDDLLDKLKDDELIVRITLKICEDESSFDQKLEGLWLSRGLPVVIGWKSL